MTAQSRRAVLALGAAASLPALPLLSAAPAPDAVETLRRASEEFARVLATVVPPPPPAPAADQTVPSLIATFREVDTSIPQLVQMAAAISAAYEAAAAFVDEHVNRDVLAEVYFRRVVAAKSGTTREARAKLTLATWCDDAGYCRDDTDSLRASALADLARLGAMT